MSDYDNIKLTELAVKELLGYLRAEGRTKNRVLNSLDVALFVRVHELGGHPISSRFAYNEEKILDSDKNPIGLVVRELGPLQDVIKLAEFYNLDAESLHKELRENPCCFLDTDFQHDENRVIFRVSNRFRTATSADQILISYTKIRDLKNLEALLKKSKKVCEYKERCGKNKK